MSSSASSRARFDQIYAEHFDSISRYCHRRLGTGDANDATAEVFVVAWRKIHEVPHGDGTLPWLYRVARYEVSRSHRTTRRLRALRSRLDQQPRLVADDPVTEVVRDAEYDRVTAALRRLREPDQEILRLRAFEHLTLAEIAVVLGCSVAAAKQRSARAVKRLRRAADLSGLTADVANSRAIEEGGEV